MRHSCRALTKPFIYEVILRLRSRYHLIVQDKNSSILAYVAANVRRLRTEQGMSQQMLADEAEISIVSMYRVEHGLLNITVTVLDRLARALGVEPAALLAPARLESRPRGRPKEQAKAKKR